MKQPFGCRVCGTVVPQTVSKTNPNRLYQSEFCSSECRKVQRKAYLSKWGAENKDLVRAYRDSNRDQVRQWGRECYERNRERRKKLRIKYYQANTEKSLAAAKKYAAENPDLIRKINRKGRMQRRARLIHAFVEVVDPAAVFARDKGICGICKKPVDPNSRWDIDHIHPLSKGGAHCYSNVQLAHARCNRSKGAKLPKEVAA